jgi:photosystem II stability/assembly factor-like uncharacterized protein
MGKAKKPAGSPGGKKASAAKAQVLKPVKLTRKDLAAVERDEGPRSWFLAMVESAYARLAGRNAPPRPAPAGRPATEAFASTLQPGQGEAVLAELPTTFWIDILKQYKARKVARAVRALPGGAVAAPAVPGAKNWLPLGPTVVQHGQTVGNEPIGGRVPGLAIAPGGQRIYVASANGGVFRSDDGGTSWRSLMDGFDLDPTNFASTSLACGAIAIDPAAPDRVYVGTGEGDTNQMFANRVVNALPAYRGVGPIRSDDGGATWVTEPSSPDLAGEAFFALAVDPRNRENVVAATSAGLYQRVSDAGGQFRYVRRREGVHSSVVVAGAGNNALFLAAQWGTGVFYSADGTTWTVAGTGFPTDAVGRIALGVQRGNPNLVYAFVANTSGGVQGVYRLDGVTLAWKPVNNVPDVLPAKGQQGDYDLSIAVDPADENLIYLGGSFANEPAPNTPDWPWPAAIWRCPVQAVGAGYQVAAAASIGTHAHSDVHVLIHTPNDPNELWCGCDGGVFLNRDPRGSGEFAGLNQGLACLCSNFIAQHPTDPSILFTGLQDNGTARTSGGPLWTHVNFGDGGYCVINWANPSLVLSFANGTVYRSDSGGTSEDSWPKAWDFPWATMTQPIVTPPYNPQSPGEANLVAAGAGSMVFLSEDFALSWTMQFSLPATAGSVFALAFASATRLFVGTTLGQVFRADRSGNNWTTVRLDDAAAGPIGLVGLISDVAVDWKDSARSSVFIAFGGVGDARRVWRFDGTRWEVRSGSAPGSSLLNVEHNVVVVDPKAADNVYVGADIGVWHSSDGGLNWAPMENGLPDAPVFDLQIHPTQRLLRAATHGRGVYEIPLD